MTHQEVLVAFSDDYKDDPRYTDIVAAAYAGARALDDLCQDNKEYDDSTEYSYYGGGALDLSSPYETAMGLCLPYDQCMTKQELVSYIDERCK